MADLLNSCTCGGGALAALKERLAAKERIIIDMFSLQASYAIFGAGFGCRRCKYEAKQAFVARSSAELQSKIAISLLTEGGSNEHG